jgi:hypothetical protein
MITAVTVITDATTIEITTGGDTATATTTAVATMVDS